MNQEELRESELRMYADMMIEIVQNKGRYKFMSERKILSWYEVMELLEINGPTAKAAARIAKQINPNFGYGLASITYKERYIDKRRKEIAQEKEVKKNG